MKWQQRIRAITRVDPFRVHPSFAQGTIHDKSVLILISLSSSNRISQHFSTFHYPDINTRKKKELFCGSLSTKLFIIILVAMILVTITCDKVDDGSHESFFFFLHDNIETFGIIIVIN